MIASRLLLPRRLRGYLHLLMGRIWLHAGRKDRARREFEVALGCGSDEFSARVSLGRIALAEGRLGQAHAEILRARRCDPERFLRLERPLREAWAITARLGLAEPGEASVPLAAEPAAELASSSERAAKDGRFDWADWPKGLQLELVELPDMLGDEDDDGEWDEDAEVDFDHVWTFDPRRGLPEDATNNEEALPLLGGLFEDPLVEGSASDEVNAEHEFWAPIEFDEAPGSGSEPRPEMPEGADPFEAGDGPHFDPPLAGFYAELFRDEEESGPELGPSGSELGPSEEFPVEGNADATGEGNPFGEEPPGEDEPDGEWPVENWIEAFDFQLPIDTPPEGSEYSGNEFSGNEFSGEEHAHRAPPIRRSDIEALDWIEFEAQLRAHDDTPPTD